MATKTVCDGCGNEIKAWKPGVPTLDALKRTLRLSTGNNFQEWDLCDPCQGKVASALVELLPNMPLPIQDWWDAIRPTKHA